MHAEIEAYIYSTACMGTSAPALRVADCVPLHLYTYYCTAASADAADYRRPALAPSGRAAQTRPRRQRLSEARSV